MGCFNVACSLSKLSINAGDPIVFVPLLSRKYDHEGSHGRYTGYKGEGVDMRPGSTSLIYSNALYNILGFPIKGTYNDYGSIENIEYNGNVKALEKFFGCDVEDLCHPENVRYALNKDFKEKFQFGQDLTPSFLKSIGFKGYEKSFFFLEADGFDNTRIEFKSAVSTSAIS